MSRFTGFMALVLAGAVFLSAGDAPKAGTYTVDASHSKVGFEISHLVIATVEGRFGEFEGKITAADDFSKTTFEATIQAASIDTDEKKRDDHLRAPDFFDTNKYKEITFKSKSVSGKPGKFKVVGDLTIRGVTKEVTLNGKYTGTVNDPWGNTKAGFKLKGEINRQDFGLSWSKMIEVGPVVGDEVELDIKLETKYEK